MKKLLLLVFAALVIPSVALAHPAKPVPQVTYQLKGTLSAYTPYNATTLTNGSITVAVSDANDPGKTLKGQTLTFAVDANTEIDLDNHTTTITDGDSGTVSVKAAKNIPPASLATTLQASPATKVENQGVKKVPMVTYVLKGTLSNFSAYNSVGPVNGSITILVKKGDHQAKPLKGMTLTFAVDANTKITLHDAAPIANGDKGVVKVRAPKKIAKAVLAATLQTYPATQIIDQGAPKPKKP